MINKKPLIKFLIWVSILFVLVFVGVNNIFALETKTIYSVNNNGTLSSANTYNYGYLTGGGTQGSARANVNTTINGVAYGFNFQFYENVVLNKTYTLEINFMDIDLLKTFNSSMVQISTCNSITCNENTLVSVVKNNNNGNSNKLTIQFNPITTGSIILVNLGSDQPITGVSTFGIKSVTLDSSNPNQDIIDSNTQNSNNIINNQNSNTQDIIDSSASNTEEIINNQSQNTLNIIYNDYTCKIQTITNYEGAKNVALNSSGQAVNADNFVISDYILLYPDKNYTLTKENWGSGRAYCLYNFNKELISCTAYSTSTSFSFTGAYYIRYTWSNANNRTVNLYGDVCLKDSQEQTNAINDLNDSVNNDNVDDNDIASSFETFNDFLDDNSTITQLITLPITLYTAILNNVNGTCQPFNLGKLYGEDLILPCINISQYLGSSLWTMIDIIISGFAVYAISKKMIKVFNNFSSLREGDVIDD